MISLKKFWVVLVLLSTASLYARAFSMEGSYLGFRVYNINTGLTYADVANGVRLVDPNVTYDGLRASSVFSDTNIDILYKVNMNWASWVGYEYYDANGTMNSFSSATFNPATNLIGLDSSRITFDANHIWINMGGLRATPGSRISIDIATTVTAVPEPETYALMLAGLSLVGAVARRRKAKQA